MMFRLLRSCVQRIIEDVMSTTVGDVHRFYARSMDATGKMGASYEAKILLPFKTFAYGFPSHTFIDYLQMSKVYLQGVVMYLLSQ
jgi:hypothetical protein